MIVFLHVKGLNRLYILSMPLLKTLNSKQNYLVDMSMRRIRKKGYMAQNCLQSAETITESYHISLASKGTILQKLVTGKPILYLVLY